MTRRLLVLAMLVSMSVWAAAASVVEAGGGNSADAPGRTYGDGHDLRNATEGGRGVSHGGLNQSPIGSGPSSDGRAPGDSGAGNQGWDNSSSHTDKSKNFDKGNAGCTFDPFFDENPSCPSVIPD
jgi:hypothetical protein